MEDAPVDVFQPAMFAAIRDFQASYFIEDEVNDSQSSMTVKGSTLVEPFTSP